MNIIRVYATDDGGSSIEEISVDVAPVNFVPGEPVMNVSHPEASKSVKFLQVAPDWYGGWHPSPVRQYMLFLSGGCEIETTDGKSRQFKPGDILLLADTTGRGHETKMLGEAPSWIAAIELE